MDFEKFNESGISSNVREFSVSSQLCLPDLLFQKKAPDNIFITKSRNLKTKGLNVGVPIKLMNQNFSKSKILHESAKLEYFQWRDGDENFEFTNFGSLKSLDFQQLSYF